jgi:cytochrome c-type biogenesis protein CcmH/NrfG
MKSGTAQKLVLNMLSTAVMIQLGRVRGNKMVDMQLSNHKLVLRAIRMVCEATGVSEQQAAELLEKAVAINSSNIAAKVKLAQSYTDGTGETMKGVLMLREVAQADPSNLAAGITLGRLAVQSGQFDKAITRLEKLLIAHPKNTEAMYFLAESYKGQGNTAKAKELFNECKKIVNNPNFTKEIDDYIKTF